MDVNQFEKLKNFAMDNGILITAVDTFYNTIDKIYYKDGTLISRLELVGHGYLTESFTEAIKHIEIPKGLSNESIIRSIIRTQTMQNTYLL